MLRRLNQYLKKMSELVFTLRNMTLMRRIKGGRPHAPNATIATAGINFSARGLPDSASYDLYKS